MDIAYDLRFLQTVENKKYENLVLKKMRVLSNKFKWIVAADVFLKEEKETNGKGKICEIRLSVPAGPRIFASSNEESFELAIPETIRDLQVQLIKRKDLMKRH